MAKPIYEKNLTELKELIVKTGREVVKIYNDFTKNKLMLQEVLIANKENFSPLTYADLSAHKILTEGLNKLTPNIPIVSEESTLPCDYNEQDFWLIDPLDGTREFIQKSGEFTINIAYIQKYKPVFGIIFVPVTGELFFGGEGLRAARCVNNKNQFISVSENAEDKAINIAVSKSHLDVKTKNFVKKIQNINLLPIGSSLKFCLIANGKADLYIRFASTSEWDTAAGQAILESAGGFVADLYNQPLIYGKKNILNPYFIAGKNSLRKIVMPLLNEMILEGGV